MSKKIIISIVVLVILAGVAVGVLMSRDRQSTDTPVVTNSEKNCTTYNGTIKEQCAEDYTNIPVNEAGEKAKENGLVPKVTKRDGKGQINTDEGSTPIYFEVEEGIVVNAYFEHD